MEDFLENSHNYDLNNYDDVSQLIHKMYSLKYPKNILIKIINSLFNKSFPNSIPTIVQLLIEEKDYSLALEYCNLGLKGIKDDHLLFLKGVCYYYLKEYDKCIEVVNHIKSKEYIEMSKDLIYYCNSLH
ncbi:MAG: hypothetical protein AB6733_21350 [Clostridiaceae bacterium]